MALVLIEQVGWLGASLLAVPFLITLGMAVYLFPRNPRLYPGKLFFSLLILISTIVVGGMTYYVIVTGIRPFGP